MKEFLSDGYSRESAGGKSGHVPLPEIARSCVMGLKMSRDISVP